MRRELVWGLGISMALSGWALLGPASKTANGVVKPSARTVEPSALESSAALPGGGSSKSAAPAYVARASLVAAGASLSQVLPTSWPQPRMEMASRSPFDTPTAVAPKTVVVAPPPAAPMPSSPVIAYRYWGSLIPPGGKRVIYLVRTDNTQPVAVESGTRLDGGYVVEQINAGSVVLALPSSEQRTTLPLTSPNPVSMR